MTRLAIRLHLAALDLGLRAVDRLVPECVLDVLFGPDDLGDYESRTEPATPRPA